MIRVIYKPVQLSPSQHTSRWVTIKKNKDYTTSKFASALEDRINEDIYVDHEIMIFVEMKKSRDKFVWDFSKVPESADGIQIIRYIKTRSFSDIFGNFYF